MDHHRFEEIIESAKIDAAVAEDTALTAEDWQRVVGEYKDMVAAERGEPFPQDPHAQLWGAIGAVFGSWMNPRANTYRRLHDIPASWGTAVNVQAMVFGNMGEDCATGVCFTRDPSTGEDLFYGEYLVNAQGEDVVAGIRTPQPLSRARAKPGEVAMEEALPAAYADLLQAYARPWSGITATCRTSSSPSSRTGCICCKLATESARRQRACGSRWRWPRPG